MFKVVIDTNVLLVASKRHPKVSCSCVENCIDRLQRVLKSGCVVIDDKFLILGEYCKKIIKKNKNEEKGVGEVFVKWLLQNRTNRKRVRQVELKVKGDGNFEEFPDTLEGFDPSDRKFVAVANAAARKGRAKPAVLQASDSKWWCYREKLKECGICVEFLCSEDIRRFCSNKCRNNSSC